MTPSKTFTKYFIGWGMTPHIGGVLKITPHMGGVISIYPIMGGVFYDTIQDICKIFYWVGYDHTYRWGIKKLPHLWWVNYYLPHLWAGYFMTPSKTFSKYFIGWGMTPHIGGINTPIGWGILI